jgi:hypothetical protein
MRLKYLFPFVALFLFSCRNKQEFDLDKLQGKWLNDRGSARQFEQWTSLGEDNLQGFGYALKGADTVFAEHMHLYYVNGILTYEVRDPDQNNNEVIAFPLTAQSSNTLSFENALHDFPTRIVYVLQSDSNLVAYVEGEIDGKTKRIDYVFHKIK